MSHIIDWATLKTLLWQNPDPTIGMSGGNVYQLAENDFEDYVVEFRRITGANCSEFSKVIHIPRGSTANVQMTQFAILGDTEMRFRTVTLSRTQLQTGPGQYRSLLDNAASINNSSYYIPVAVYGIPSSV